MKALILTLATVLTVSTSFASQNCGHLKGQSICVGDAVFLSMNVEAEPKAGRSVKVREWLSDDTFVSMDGYKYNVGDIGSIDCVTLSGQKYCSNDEVILKAGAKTGLRIVKIYDLIGGNVFKTQNGSTYKLSDIQSKAPDFASEICGIDLYINLVPMSKKTIYSGMSYLKGTAQCEKDGHKVCSADEKWSSGGISLSHEIGDLCRSFRLNAIECLATRKRAADKVTLIATGYDPDPALITPAAQESCGWMKYCSTIGAPKAAEVFQTLRCKN